MAAKTCEYYFTNQLALSQSKGELSRMGLTESD